MDTDKLELENEFPDTSGLVKKTDYNTKITEIDGKIPDINNLATETALTTVENKIPDVNSLVKKTDYNIRVAEIDTKLSRLDGKIAKYENKKEKFLSFLMGNIMFDSVGGSQVDLIF